MIQAKETSQVFCLSIITLMLTDCGPLFREPRGNVTPAISLTDADSTKQAIPPFSFTQTTIAMPTSFVQVILRFMKHNHLVSSLVGAEVQIVSIPFIADHQGACCL